MSISVQAHPIHELAKASKETIKRGDPCTVVMFGATGDLAKRKLIAALFDLAQNKLLPDDFLLLGVDRTPLDDSQFRALMKQSAQASEEIPGFDETVWQSFEPRLAYVQGDLTKEDVYATIKDRLSVLENHRKTEDRNHLFYLSVPPFIFEPIVKHLALSGLAPRTPHAADRPWGRIIVEKPFGTSLSSALALNDLVLGRFSEHQVYRIDHYLGKETVQNLLVLRAANAIFEPVWNRQHISHVQITASETVGVEARGSYYESAGVVRDMFQNHLMQLLALTSMELPTSMEANAVRDEKVKVLRAVRPFTMDVIDSMVRAQYAAGELKGKQVIGYREEPGVSKESVTPTYAAIRFMIANGRWRGVPFYLRSGKRMKKRLTEIAVHFRVPPYLIHGLSGREPQAPVDANVLVVRVQPNDAITMRFQVKLPGASYQLTPEIETDSVDMDFNYVDAFKQQGAPAYETLLLDAMNGEMTLFTRSDEVEIGWRITDPLLERWAETPPESMPTYASGSWGPDEADELLAKNNFAWRQP